jgi:DNA-binding transcriptional MerR regulator
MADGAANGRVENWSVGELARATGLSVRTLRHWDEIGLVSPGRTTGGHRCYTGAEVAQLYQVLALRQMGLGLAQIATLLTDADPSPRDTLRTHLRQVQADLAARQALRDRLVEVLDALDTATGTTKDDDPADGLVAADSVVVDSSLLMKVIEKMTMFEQHLTAEQRSWFTHRREQVGEHTWQHAIAQWPELLAALRAEMDAGTDPAHPRVQQLMSRWTDLQRVFLDDSPEMRTAAGHAWQAIWHRHPDQLHESSHLAAPDMWDYIQRAHNARPDTN